MALIITHRKDADRYDRALDMIERGHRELRELGAKMEYQYGERKTYGDRDGDGRYNERYEEHDGGYYGERRDSMGRYR